VVSSGKCKHGDRCGGWQLCEDVGWCSVIQDRSRSVIDFEFDPSEILAAVPGMSMPFGKYWRSALLI
jgi:hypothetical protein